MNTLTSQQIDAPQNWDDFENLCAELWTLIWDATNTQRNGRDGQRQHGVDIFASVDGCYHGIQCKLKDRTSRKKLSRREIEDEIKKAKSFTPKLATFIIATTASPDANLQQLAREVSDQHRAIGLFTVEVIGWEEILRRIERYPQLVARYYPNYLNVADRVLALERLNGAANSASATFISDLGRQSSSSLRRFSRAGAFVPESTQPHSTLDATEIQIDTYRDLIAERPQTALGLLEEFWTRTHLRLSPHARFRVKTNIAVARLQIGDEQSAAAGFLSALEHDPSNLIGRCNAALAHFLSGNPALARAECEKVIAQHGHQLRAFLVLIAAAESVSALSDLVAGLTQLELQDKSVWLAVGYSYSRMNDIELAEQSMRRAFDIDSTCPRVRAAYAEAILNRIMSDEIRSVAGQFDSTHESEWTSAKQALLEVWLEIRETENAPAFLPQAILLANVLRFSGDLELAEQVAADACRIRPSDSEVRAVAAYIALDRGEPAAAVAHLDEIRMPLSASDSLKMVEAMAAAGRLSDALDRLNATSLADAPGGVRRAAVLLRSHILELKGQPEEVLGLLSGAMETSPADAVLAAQLARAHYVAGRGGDGSAAAKLAISLVAAVSSVSDRLTVANILFECGRFEDALSIFEGLLHVRSDSPVFRRYVLCLLSTNRRKAAAEAIEALPSSHRARRFYRRAACNLYCTTGQLDRALAECLAFIAERPEDLEFRLVWIGICQRLGRIREVQEFLREHRNYSDASPELQVRLAHVLYQFGQPERALDLAYELRRTFTREEQVHLGYVGLLFHDDLPHQMIWVDEVGVGTAFGVKDADGEASTYFIVDDDEALVGREEVRRDHPIAQAALGRICGDSFEHAATPFQSVSLTITWIKSKYLYVFHESLRDFSTLFPSSSSLVRMKLPGANDGGLDVSPILRTVDSRAQQVAALTELYTSGRLPIGTFSRLLGRSPIETLEAIVADPSLEINCSVGDNTERELALACLTNAQKGVVVDPLSLFLMVNFRVADAIASAFGGIYVAQSTLDLFRHLIRDLEVLPPSGSFAKYGEKYVLQEFGAAHIADRIQRYQRVLDWCVEHCALVPAIAAQDQPRQTELLLNAMDDSFVDSMLAASGTDRPLICDDRTLRECARETFGVRGAWLQISLLVAMQRGSLELVDYARIVSELAAAGFSFTFVDASVLWQVAESDGWVVSNRTTCTFNLLKEPGIDVDSALMVGHDFLRMLWRNQRLRRSRVLYTNLVLAAVAGWMSPAIVRYFLQSTPPVSDEVEFYEVVRGWCRGHFLDGWV